MAEGARKNLAWVGEEDLRVALAKALYGGPLFFLFPCCTGRVSGALAVCVWQVCGCRREAYGRRQERVVDSDYHDDGDDAGWVPSDASRAAAAKRRKGRRRVSRTSDVNESDG